MRYFGRKFTAHHSVSMSGGSWEIKYSPRTKHYTIQMTDSEQKAYAHVENAKKIPNGNIKMTGIL